MDWIKQIIVLIVALLLQVLLISNLHFLGVCHPYIYIVFLLMMPIRLPKIVDMLIGFALGFLMDIFCNSIGVHIASCTLLMFLRRIIIENLVMDHDRISGEINGQSIGIDNYIRYVIVLTLLHHAMVFLLSAWSFSHFGFTLLEIIVSSIISITLILGYDYIRK